MRLAHVWILGIKELRSLARDPIMLGLIGFVYTVAIYSAARALPETLNKAPIAIVDEDQSPLSNRIIGAFYPPYFLPPRVISLSEMDARMDAGLDTFALYIPADFQRDLLDGRSPAVQLNVDATRVTQAFSGSGYVQNIVSQEIQAFAKGHRMVPELPVNLRIRSRFNQMLNRSWFGSVVELINNVTMLAIVLTGAALIRERERGTIEHLLVMPVTPLEIMVSKVWSMGVVVLGACALSLTLVIRGWLGVPIHGSVILFLLGGVLYLFATTSMGIFLATLARSMPQFGLLSILVFLPLKMLSGGSTPRESMPVWVQDVMLGAPTTHYVQLAQGVLFRGGGLEVVWPQLLALLVLGAIFFGIALGRFRRALTTMA